MFGDLKWSLDSQLHKVAQVFLVSEIGKIQLLKIPNMFFLGDSVIKEVLFLIFSATLR